MGLLDLALLPIPLLLTILVDQMGRLDLEYLLGLVVQMDLPCQFRFQMDRMGLADPLGRMDHPSPLDLADPLDRMDRPQGRLDPPDRLGPLDLQNHYLQGPLDLELHLDLAGPLGLELHWCHSPQQPRVVPMVLGPRLPRLRRFHPFPLGPLVDPEYLEFHQFPGGLGFPVLRYHPRVLRVPVGQAVRLLPVNPVLPWHLVHQRQPLFR